MAAENTDRTSMWRKIPDRDYEVSRDGEVWSRRRKTNMKKNVIGGYNSVKLCKNEIGKPFRVDMLVAQAFLPKPKDILVHKNGDKLDDRESNLKWMTYQEYFGKLYPGEIWKQIEDHKDFFISSNGRIWSRFIENIISMREKEGYICASIDYTFFHVHVLVAKTFLGHVPGNGVVCHKNGDNLDNCVENLEIVRKGDRKIKNTKKYKIAPREKAERPEGKVWPGNENYVVTEDGRIYNIEKQYFLSMGNCKSYFTVSIGGKTFYRHRMVAETYLEKPSEECTQVNHIDGNKQNNHVSNLEWVTQAQNSSHAVQSLYKEKIITSNQMPVISTDEDGIEREYSGVKAAWRETGINSGTISAVCKGRGKTAGGLKWRYKFNY